MAGLPVVACAESVTALEDVAGKVLVAGSHGGIIAAYYGAKAGAHALILNDAGIGRDEAGVAGLAWLDAIGMAAAAVSHVSARIGDGADMLARGILSRVNERAGRAGLLAGMSCRAAAERLRSACAAHAPPPAYAEGRKILVTGNREAWGLDSVGMLTADDAGRVLVIGSHGALHGGRPESALAVAACAAVFNDAGVGMDGIGITRLPVLDARGIPAATVDCASARIGDAQSMWDSGVLSHVNAAAGQAGASRGDSVRSFVSRFCTAKPG